MRVVVTVEGRFCRTPDGTIWTHTGHDYPHWTRYLSAFNQVRVVARLRDTFRPPPGAALVTGRGVEFWDLPYYVGPWQYLLRRLAIGRRLRDAASIGDAVILRVPSPLGTLLAAIRGRQRLPYAVEVVGDPWEVFAPGVVRHPLRPLIRRWAARSLRRQCRTAVVARYATERFLQQRYPPSPSAVVMSFSDVDLAPAAFVPAPRAAVRPRGASTLISVGSLEQPYKGIATLLEAMALLMAAGSSLHLVHVGEGRYRPQLEQLARRRGVADRVTFTGALASGDAVRGQLDAADLFVMPSLTEGLPRALIEAMARGLPAIGSAVGGIPELLPPQFLVPPGDAVRLADAIGALLTQPHTMADASTHNLARARDFSRATLAPRRLAFYTSVASATACALDRDVDR